MGLNLNIKRLVFHTVTKMTNLNVGFGLDLLSPSSVKQIGGRAGRMSSDYKIGTLSPFLPTSSTHSWLYLRCYTYIPNSIYIYIYIYMCVYVYRYDHIVAGG